MIFYIANFVLSNTESTYSLVKCRHPVMHVDGVTLKHVTLHEVSVWFGLKSVYSEVIIISCPAHVCLLVRNDLLNKVEFLGTIPNDQ